MLRSIVSLSNASAFRSFTQTTMPHRFFTCTAPRTIIQKGRLDNNLIGTHSSNQSSQSLRSTTTTLAFRFLKNKPSRVSNKTFTQQFRSISHIPSQQQFLSRFQQENPSKNSLPWTRISRRFTSQATSQSSQQAPLNHPVQPSTPPTVSPSVGGKKGSSVGFGLTLLAAVVLGGGVGAFLTAPGRDILNRFMCYFTATKDTSAVLQDEKFQVMDSWFASPEKFHGDFYARSSIRVYSNLLRLSLVIKALGSDIAKITELSPNLVEACYEIAYKWFLDIEPLSKRSYDEITGEYLVDPLTMHDGEREEEQMTSRQLLNRFQELIAERFGTSLPLTTDDADDVDDQTKITLKRLLQIESLLHILQKRAQQRYESISKDNTNSRATSDDLNQDLIIPHEPRDLQSIQSTTSIDQIHLLKVHILELLFRFHLSLLPSEYLAHEEHVTLAEASTNTKALSSQFQSVFSALRTKYDGVQSIEKLSDRFTAFMSYLQLCMMNITLFYEYERVYPSYVYIKRQVEYATQISSLLQLLYQYGQYPGNFQHHEEEFLTAMREALLEIVTHCEHDVPIPSPKQQVLDSTLHLLAKPLIEVSKQDSQNSTSQDGSSSSIDQLNEEEEVHSVVV